MGNIRQHDSRIELDKRCDDVLAELKACSITSPFIAKEYADSMGVKESQIRMVIRELRLKGIRICSDPGHRGYWLEEHGGGYEITRNQMLSRAFRIFEVVRAMDGNKDGQYEWDCFKTGAN